jgi:hypothetical protein
VTNVDFSTFRAAVFEARAKRPSPTVANAAKPCLRAVRKESVDRIDDGLDPMRFGPGWLDALFLLVWVAFLLAVA